jgi:hypothetical protein
MLYTKQDEYQKRGKEIHGFLTSSRENKCLQYNVVAIDIFGAVFKKFVYSHI